MSERKLKKTLLLSITVVVLSLILSACKPTRTVSFETFGGTPVESIVVPRNSLLNEQDIPVPQKSSVRFAGWYKEKELKTEWSFSSEKVKRDITLYAKYVETEQPIEYTLNDDGASYSVSQKLDADGKAVPTSNIVIPASYKDLPVTKIADEGFSLLKSSLRTVRIAAPLKVIGVKAFYQCSILTSVTFDDGSKLDEISESAFEDCRILKDITLPASLKTIGKNAFRSCSALNSVGFESGSKLETIVEYAFYQDSLLKSIGEKQADGSIGALPSSLKTIEAYAFWNCSKLTGLSFGENAALTTIARYAFYGVASSYIKFPKSLTSLGDHAFSDSKLVTVDFEEGIGLAKIESSTFYNCVSLAYITLPPSITSIESSAFSNTSSLKRINVTSLLNLSGTGLFTSNRAGAVVVRLEDLAEYKRQNAANARYITAEGYEPEASETAYSQIIDEKYLVYFEKVDGKIEKTLLAYVSQSQEVQALTISIDGLVKIDKYAFSGVKTVSGIAFSASSEYEIGDNAFTNCTALTSVDISGAKSISSSAFAGSGITSVVLGNYLTSIPMNAFKNCKGLTSIIIPASVTEIFQEAFYSCSALLSVTFENGSALASIYGYAFSETALTSVVIPNGVTYIGANAFSKCKALGSVVLPNNAGFKTIDTRLFAECPSLASITVPDGVQTIGNGAFDNCVSLASVVFGASSSLEAINATAFQNCSKLYVMRLPASLETVAVDAFYGCKIKAFYVDSLINLSQTDNGGVPSLTALLSTKAGTLQNGRVIILDPSVLAAYKDQDVYAANAFIASKASVSGSGGGEMITADNGETLVAFFGTNANVGASELAGFLTIGQYAFADCVLLEEAFIPNSVGVVEKRAFSGCTALLSVEFEEKLTPSETYRIEANAFSDCAKADVIIRNVGYIGASAFSGFSNSQTITIYGSKSLPTSQNWAASWKSNCYASVNWVE
jgi:hypothetical protein